MNTTPQTRFACTFQTSVPLLVATLLLVLGSLGCDGHAPRESSVVDTGNAKGGRLISSALSPRATIEQCVRSYQRLASYQDDAYVRLQYRIDGQVMEDRAPLAVAWDARGRIGLRAYSVQAGPEGGRWRLRLGDDAGVPGQVLSRDVPSQVDFAWLLNDPLVAQRLSAGLAGFPPQLDLLLSEKPLARLIDDSSALAFATPQTIDGHACHVVSIVRGQSEFVMFIDQNSLLLRRLLLPRSHLTPEMLSDQRVTDVRLAIEFRDARIDTPVQWDRFSVPVKPDEQLLSRFVPEPPLVDLSGLGEQVPAFFLEAPSGDVAYQSDSNVNRKATVLMWLADHPACRAAAEELRHVAEHMHSVGADEAIEFVSVWAQPQPPAGSSFETLAQDWQLPGVLTIDRHAMGRDVFGVQEAPTLIVVDRTNRLQLRETRANPLLDQLLPGLLQRLVDGHNLAAEMIDRQAETVKRHRAELSMAAAIDSATMPHLPKIGGDGLGAQAYGPVSFQLTQLDRQPTPAMALAAVVDARSAMWILHADGSLLQHDRTVSEKREFRTRWKLAVESPGRLRVSPSAEQVAFAAFDGGPLHLFDCEMQRQRTIDLEPGERVRDLEWFQLESHPTPRLAVITSAGRTLLIDPVDQEQLSGRSEVEPVAILSAQAIGGALAGKIVLADGTVETIEIVRGSSAEERALADDRQRSDALSHGRSLATATNAAGGASSALPEPLRKLAFQPDQGPWLGWREGPHEWTLARGWLAKNEPAVFMLDKYLQQLWHYPMPLQTVPQGDMTMAVDPRSGQPMWALSSQGRRVHLLRGDGLRTDHFTASDEIVGLTLIARGDHLELSLVHPRQVVHYALAESGP